MQHLTMTTATNDPVPLFCRIADADPHLRRFLFGGQRPGRRMEATSCYWRFLLMNMTPPQPLSNSATLKNKEIEDGNAARAYDPDADLGLGQIPHLPVPVDCQASHPTCLPLAQIRTRILAKSTQRAAPTQVRGSRSGGIGIGADGTSDATETCGHVRPLKSRATFCEY